MGEPENYVICRECGGKYEQLTYHHLKFKHNMSFKEYRVKYPGVKTICDMLRQKQSEVRSLRNGFAGFIESINDLLPLPFCACGCGGRVHNIENCYIKYHHSREKRRHSKKSIEKMRNSKLGHAVSRETRDKIRKRSIQYGAYKIGSYFFDLPTEYPLCACGCGGRVAKFGNRYIIGHTHVGREHSPEERKKRTKKLRGLRRTAETRERIRLATLGHPVSEETREKLSAALKGYIPSDEARRNMGAAQQRIWSEYTSEERVIRIRKISVRQSPNNEEIRLGEILLELGYVFNRRLLCSGHSSIAGRMRSIIPDFVSKEHPMYIVQYDGWLGHSPDSHRTRDDQAEWDNERDEICSDNGYTVIRVYPEDLRKGGKHIKDMMEEIICQSINM